MRLQVIRPKTVRISPTTIYKNGNVPPENVERYALVDNIKKVISERKMIISSNLPVSPSPFEIYNRELYAVILKETPSIPVYPEGWVHSEPRVGKTNSPFKKRSIQGEIVVSPFSAGNSLGKYKYSTKETVDATKLNTNIPIQQLNVFQPGPEPGTISFNGARYHGTVQVDYEIVTIRDVAHPLELGFTPAGLETSLGVIDFTFDDPLVLACLSDANSGTLDLLTTLAEMPEALSSLMDGLRLLMKMQLELRRKEFTLTARNEQLKKKVQQRCKSLDLEIAELSEQITSIEKRGGIVSDAAEQRKLRQKRLNLIRKRRRLQKKKYSLGKELYQLTEELATAIASIWMNFRYNIEPIRMTIEDGVKALSDYGRAFARWRKAVTHEIEIPDVGPYKFTGKATLKHRVFIKRSFNANSVYEKLDQILRMNLTVTFWELIRRSFVWDWFFTIGDAISALVHDDRVFLQEGATYSWKLEVDGVFQHTANNSTVEFTKSSYKRIVINPRSSIGIYLVPDWNLFRQLDTAAMLWPTVKAEMRNQIRRFDKS